MRILFLTTWFPYPPDNGSKIRVYHLLRALSQAHQVDLISFAFGTADPAAPSLRSLCQTINVIHSDPHKRSPLKRILRFLSPQPIVTQPLKEMGTLINETIRHQKYDAVIASTKGMAVYAQYVPAIAYILEEHNSGNRQMYERYRAAHKPLQKLQFWVSWQKTRRFEAQTFPHFDLVTMVSSEDKTATVELFNEGRPVVEVVPNGVDCSYYIPGQKATQPDTLIFNGALTYSANHDAMRYFLADIYPLIKQSIPGIRLRITGSLQGVDLNGLSLDDSVELLGYVEDIRSVVSESTVCVVPLRVGGGTRLKILEAMALGIPVVTTTKGAEGLKASNQEHLLLADKPDDFAASVIELLANPTKRQQIATAARHLVERHYDWAEIGNTFAKLVEECIEANR